jgi:hypothetical protein
MDDLRVWPCIRLSPSEARLISISGFFFQKTRQYSLLRQERGEQLKATGNILLPETRNVYRSDIERM